MRRRADARRRDPNGRHMSLELVDQKNAGPVPGDLDVAVAIQTTHERAGWDRSDAMIDEWGRQSFPASDPPSNW
jgi:hypothetical protein